jgi:hypothetical protein
MINLHSDKPLKTRVKYKAMEFIIDQHIYSINLTYTTNRLTLFIAVIRYIGSNRNQVIFAEQDILDNLELMAGLCAAKRFDVPLFLTIVEQAEMDSDELYRQYVGKNVLNFFRQDHGYKEGTYKKIWNGREDNEHLVEVLNSLDIGLSDYSDKIYASLKLRYTIE